jgi:hypothetical protein
VTRLAPLFFAALVTLSSPALPNDGQITLVVGFAAGGDLFNRSPGSLLNQ